MRFVEDEHVSVGARRRMPSRRSPRGRDPARARRRQARHPSARTPRAHSRAASLRRRAGRGVRAPERRGAALDQARRPRRRGSLHGRPRRRLEGRRSTPLRPVRMPEPRERCVASSRPPSACVSVRCSSWNAPRPAARTNSDPSAVHVCSGSSSPAGAQNTSYESSSGSPGSVRSGGLWVASSTACGDESASCATAPPARSDRNDAGGGIRRRARPESPVVSGEVSRDVACAAPCWLMGQR